MGDSRCPRTMLNSYNHLGKVHWSPSGDTSALLSQLQIQHGFCGINAQRPHDLHHVKQVHGTSIVSASASTESVTTDRPEADGVWTRQGGLAVAVRTADCLPILLASTDGKIVAAIHAGWRGLVAGILFQGIKKLPSAPDTLIACIGPAISRERFEVGPEVIEATQQGTFGLTAEQAALIISKGRGDRWHLDLAAAAALQLINAGILPRQIEVIHGCTQTLASEWHSYRREGKDCGSNWSWIRTKS